MSKLVDMAQFDFIKKKKLSMCISRDIDQNQHDNKREWNKKVYTSEV